MEYVRQIWAQEMRTAGGLVSPRIPRSRTGSLERHRGLLGKDGPRAALDLERRQHKPVKKQKQKQMGRKRGR